MPKTKFHQLKDKYVASQEIRTDYQILSSNRVTGWSVNFPIVSTCRPSKVCAMTCYGLKGPITWGSSLNKHARNHLWCKSDPKGFAEQLEIECKKNLKKNPDFYIRWNGVGDLFHESVEALKILNKKLPDLPIWCVTRIPEQTTALANLNNVFIHFSLDKSSMKRREEVLKKFKKRPKNLFFSYQCDANERLKSIPSDISVLFFDQYKIPSESKKFTESSATCPLNLNEDINGMCNRCRLCFDGSALASKTESKAIN